MSYEKVGSEFAVNNETAGDQTNPQIATFADGSFLITWVSRAPWPASGQTIKAQLFDASGAKAGAEFQINDQSTDGVFNQTATVLADGTLVVTWINNDTSAGGPGGVKARMFDSAGNPLGGEFEVNTIDAGSKFTAEIASLSNGGFVITWDDWGSWDQKGQVYDATGAKVGGEFRTHVVASGNQEYGDVVGLAGGGFVASWRTQGVGGWDVYARIFDNSGTATSGDFLVNTLTSGNQDGSSLTALTGGGFVAVWLSSGAVKGQLFDASGTKVGGEFVVNQSGGTLQTPDVTALADGSFLVAWSTLDGSADGSGMAVKVRQFGADGVPVANEMLLNTLATGSQFLPDLATLADGRVVAAWASESGDGNGYAVRGQILYTANTAPEITSNGGSAVANLTVAENETAVTTVVAVDADGPLPVTYWIAGGADAGAFVIDKTSGALSFATGPDFESPADANHDGIYQVVVEARDGAWTDSQTVTVTVTDLGDGLSFLQTTLQASEMAVAAGVLSASGGTGDPMSYTITGGADAALFALDAQTGALSFAEAGDFEMPGDADGDNVYQVEVSASDGTFDLTRTISVVLNNVNEGLAIVSDAATSVVENEMLVGVVEATDVDGDAPSYSISGGADGALFWIDSDTGELSFGEAPDFETPADWDGDNVYEVEVSATDGEFLTSQLVTIAVTDVEDAPLSIVNTAFAFDENTFVAAALEVTGGLGTNLVTYWISGGADGALFYMDNDTDSLLLEAQDFETPNDWDGDNVYEVEVSVTDGTFTSSQLVTIAVSDVEEAPPLSFVNTAFAFSENIIISAAFEVTGGLGTALSYWITGGADAALFYIDSYNDALLLGPQDFEAPADWDGDNVYEVEVTVGDGEFFTSQLLTVTVTDVEDTPPLEFVNTMFDFNENVGIAAALEVTGGAGPDPVSYQITGGPDAWLFEIDQLSGALLLGARNFESPDDWNSDSIYEVEVTASRGADSVSEIVSVKVHDVNEAPVIMSDGAGDSAVRTIFENTTSVTTVHAYDPDGGSVTYALTGGADAARFTINPFTGQLRFASAPNFEAPTDSDGNNVYEVIVRASSGGLSDTQALSVSVADLLDNETIVGTSAADQLTGGTGNDTIRGMAGNDVLSGLAGADVLEGGTGRDTLSGGLGADRFEFNATNESTVGASDLILDFSRAQGDKIVLNDIDASTRASGNQAFQFIGSSAFTSGSPSHGQLRAFQSGGDTYIAGDVNGDRVADFQIVIDGLVTLTSSDFIL